MLSRDALRAFVTVADATSFDTTFTGGSSAARLMAGAQDQARTEAEEAIQGELIGIVTSLEGQVTGLSETAASLRQQADEADEASSTLRLAFTYADSTGNFLPLLVLLGFVSMQRPAGGRTASDWQTLCTILEGWSATVDA